MIGGSQEGRAGQQATSHKRVSAYQMALSPDELERKYQQKQSQPIDHFSGIYNHCCTAAMAPLPRLLQRAQDFVRVFSLTIVGKDCGELLAPSPLFHPTQSFSISSGTHHLQRQSLRSCSAPGFNKALPRGNPNVLPVTFPIDQGSPT